MSQQRRARMEPFRRHLIAHRGLFDNATDHPENTLPAFDRAVRAGYGIELDVHLTRDGQVVVTHDDDLRRICGEDVTVAGSTYEELRRHRVLASDQPMPLFTEVLDVIGGRVPLIVEIKDDGDVVATCRAADAILRDYDGVYCVESFDPRAVLWYRRNRPDVIRGQLSADFTRTPFTRSRAANWLLTSMVFNPLTCPDFLAYNHEHSASYPLWLWRALLGAVPVAWTLKSQADLDRARHRFEVFIFDSFLPDGATDPDGHAG